MGRRSTRAARCSRCRVQLESCLCAQLPRIDLEMRVALVMHYREMVKASATGPLALACLTNSTHHLHGLPGAPLDLVHLHEGGARRVLVLFPVERARPLSRALKAEDSRPITLVVPDGNWHQARRIPKRVPGLENAECVGLPVGPPTAWGLRREHIVGGLATFEAIARAIGALESLEAQARMEATFARMVQISLAARGQPKLKAVSAARQPVQRVAAAISGDERETLEVAW
jgi:DTW domain-containing protein YfiP